VLQHTATAPETHTARVPPTPTAQPAPQTPPFKLFFPVLLARGSAAVPLPSAPLRRGSVPVHEVEVAVQVARIHGAFAQLQLRLGVVVHVVHAHLFHDAKPALQHRHKPAGSGGREGRAAARAQSSHLYGHP